MLKTTTISIVILSLILFPVGLSSNAQMDPMKKTTSSGTLESVQDPGIGHETHQIAIILPPSENVYAGTLTYNASEPIQLISLHGPLAEDQDLGQPIWTTDGETKFALTFVDHEMSQGTWNFAGNALAVHTKNTEPFTVDYSLEYLETPIHGIIMSGTMQSIQDPGLGHEGHQIIIILQPGDNVISGTLTYSASEPIQLVSLRGPVGLDEQPDMTWTPDGETIFELTFVDPENAMGTWMFSGNALAVHTKHTDQFTASFSVHPNQMTPGMKGQDGMMKGQDGMMKGQDGMMKGQDGMMTGQDGMMKRTMPPMKQMKSGIAPQDITCNEGLDLIFKSHNGKPVCVKPFTASVLMERGWAMSSP